MPNSVMLPSDTLNPAKSMIASLGTGMQALSSAISRKTPGSPRASMTLVAASTIGPVMSGMTAGQHYTRKLCWSRSVWRRVRHARRRSRRNSLMSRVSDPVYRRRALQFAADAVLAAIAFALAFVLRFIDVPIGIPDRYVTMLTESIAFVAVGKAIVFGLFGLHRKWWRYFQLPDMWPVVRAAAVASGMLVAVFTLAKPFDYNLPRSVVVF